MAWGAHPALFNWLLRNTFTVIDEAIKSGCYATCQIVKSPRYA